MCCVHPPPTAGIVYGMAADDLTLLTFSLACVVVAGVFGALTVGVRYASFVSIEPPSLCCVCSHFLGGVWVACSILFVQAMPAIFALFFVQFGYKSASTFSTSHPFITLIWVLLGVLVGGVVLGVYVCLRETGFKAQKGLADSEAPRYTVPSSLVLFLPPSCSLLLTPFSSPSVAFCCQ